MTIFSGPMRMIVAPVGIVLSLVFAGMMFVPIVQPSSQTIPSGTLTMRKLSTIATQISPGCYSGFVSMNMTWTNSNVTYPIIVQDFFVVISVSNQIVANSTSTSYISPSNTIPTLLLFPSLPATLQVSFQNICGVPSTLRLFYIDPKFQFTFTLP